jgi:hypothetical protein
MIVYSLDLTFYKESESAIKIGMQVMVFYLIIIEIYDKSFQKRFQRLRMYQGSIMCAQNLNMGPGSQTTKNRKLLHVTKKSVIGPRIIKEPSLYAQNYSKVSRDPLKLHLLKSSNTGFM